MRNRFSNIVKVNKTKLEKCENEIAHLNYEQSILNTKKNKTYNDIKKFNLPSSGNFAELSTANNRLLNIRLEITKILENMDVNKHKIENKQNEYRYHNIEYEKIKYLEKEEQKKIEETIKKQEESVNNDISSFRHFQANL